MDGRVWTRASLSLALLWLVNGSLAEAQLLRFKKTGPSPDQPVQARANSRKAADNQSLAFPERKQSSDRQTAVFEPPVKVAVKSSSKRAHYDPQRSLDKSNILPTAHQKTEPVQSKRVIVPEVELLDPPTFEPPLVQNVKDEEVNESREEVDDSPIEAPLASQKADESPFELPLELPDAEPAAKDSPKDNSVKDGSQPTTSKTEPSPKTDEPLELPEPEGDTSKPASGPAPEPNPREASESAKPSDSQSKSAASRPTPNATPVPDANSDAIPPTPLPIEKPRPITPEIELPPVPEIDTPANLRPTKPVNFQPPAAEAREAKEPATTAPPAIEPPSANPPTVEPPAAAPPAARSPEEEATIPAHLPRLKEIDVRAAARISDERTSILMPANQAKLILGMRPPVRYGATAWPGYQSNRNTYPFCHNPLYFEDPNLERCGYHYGCLSTPVSAALFFGTIPTLPYRIGAELPWDCVGTLPDCRYGYSFGWDAYWPPFSWRGAAAQAAATVGLIYVVP